MEEAPKGPPWWQDESASLVRTRLGKDMGSGLPALCFFQLFSPSREPPFTPAWKSRLSKDLPNQSKRKLEKGDRSPDSCVSLVGLGRGWRSAWRGHVVHQWKTWAPEAGVQACECEEGAPGQEWAGDGGRHHVFGYSAPTVLTGASWRKWHPVPS